MYSNGSFFFFVFLQMLHLQKNTRSNDDGRHPPTTTTLITMADKLFIRVHRHRALFDKQAKKKKSSDPEDNIWQSINDQSVQLPHCRPR